MQQCVQYKNIIKIIIIIIKILCDCAVRLAYVYILWFHDDKTCKL